MAQLIPIVIACWQRDDIDAAPEDLPFYQAFSPYEYFSEGNHALQTQELIERVLDWGLANHLLPHEPMYVEDILTPLDARWEELTCFFSTYAHLIDGGRVIYPGAIAFNGIAAYRVAMALPNLIHDQCIQLSI